MNFRLRRQAVESNSIPGSRMEELELLLGLFVAALVLAGAARRVGAPYPVFLAIGGSLLALLRSGPSFTLPPELALALFGHREIGDDAFHRVEEDLDWLDMAGPGGDP